MLGQQKTEQPQKQKEIVFTSLSELEQESAKGLDKVLDRKVAGKLRR